MNFRKKMLFLSLFFIIGSIMWGLYEKAVDISIKKQFLPRPIIGAEKPIRFFALFPDIHLEKYIGDINL